jgi:hypothetical protein
MAEFIGPVLAWLVGVVTDMDMAGLEPWGEVKTTWTGISAAWPPVAVMARGTDFDPDGTTIHEAHGFTIKFGIQASEPDGIATLAIAYMVALDAAIQAAVWLPQMRRVFVSRHDYGVLFTSDGSWAKFPELHLEVEAYEQ